VTVVAGPGGRGWAATLLAGAAALVLAATPAFAVNDIVLTTGSPSGLYHPMGVEIGKTLNAVADGAVFKVSAITSPGSVTNLRRLSQGEAQMAIVQGDVLYQAVRGSTAFPEPLQGLRAVAVLFTEAVHIVARADAGIDSVAKLAGKRVALGQEGSGTALTAGMILEAAGLSPATSVDARRMSQSDTLEALRAGDVDAAFFVTAPGSSRLVELFRTVDCRLVPLVGDEISALVESIPYLNADGIAKGTYKGVEAPVPTASMDALLVTTTEAPPDLIHETIDQLHSHSDALASVLPPGLAILPERGVKHLPVPLHLGSMSFYKARGVFDRPIQVTTGLFVRDLWAFDIKHGSYMVDFEVWFKWQGRLDAGNEDFAFELVNGEIVELVKTGSEKLGGWTRVSYKARAELRGTFTLHDYPFDNQDLNVIIEHPHLGSRDLQFQPDRYVGSDVRNLREIGHAPGLKIGDWEISDVLQGSQEHIYPSDMGSLITPGQGQQFSRYLFQIQVKRQLHSYLLKFSIPLILIALMAFSVFFMHPEAYETQILVIIWVLFTAVEFHIYQSESLPEIGYMVTADMFFIWTYISIFVVLILTLRRYHIYSHSNESEESVRGITLLGRLAFLPLFFGPIIAMVWTRM
jgi:TRAP transporter TAXI family solute receptor